MKDKICEWIAYRLPKRVVFFCTMRLGVYAITEKFSDRPKPEVTFYANHSIERRKGLIEFTRWLDNIKEIKFNIQRSEG